MLNPVYRKLKYRTMNNVDHSTMLEATEKVRGAVFYILTSLEIDRIRSMIKSTMYDEIR